MTVVFQDTRHREQTFDIGVDEVKTYRINWARRLACIPVAPADTLASSTVDGDGVTVTDVHTDATAVTFTVSTVGAAVGTYPVINNIITAAGEVDRFVVYYRTREST